MSELFGNLKSSRNGFAIIDGTSGEEVSRDVVLREALRLSQALHAWGLTTQGCVVLVDSSTVEYVTRIIGVWLSEGITCPQPLGKSQADFQFVLRDSGACLVVGPNAGLEEILAAAAAVGIAYVSIALEATEEANLSFPKNGCIPLRSIWSIGAKLPLAIHQQVQEAFGIPVYEMYGMSEGGVATANDPSIPDGCKAGTAGLPRPGYRIAIFGPDGQQVCGQEIGEICIKSEMGFQGYHNRPEDEQASFIDGWFHSGDSGYLDEDGFLVVTGRIKELIDCGGLKFSPDEVDNGLQQQGDVAEAATFAVPEPMLGQVAVAAVVLRPHSKLTAEEASLILRRFVAEKLQDFKVPARVHVVKCVPRSRAQMLQRWKLAELFSGQQDKTQPLDGAKTHRNVLENVQRAWKEELSTPPAHGTANFFKSGGGSMQAAALAINLSSRLGFPINSSTIFTCPEPEKLASSIQHCMAVSHSEVSLG
ncbi:hypothetical protein WJX74_004578 [Apatococcus lobatus]|uniref:Carrier domain-containing protein n=1 Tax=Apatococcus lobatus TaxID=904363 RepID=A0AAW1RKX8_9CHLO